MLQESPGSAFSNKIRTDKLSAFQGQEWRNTADCIYTEWLNCSRAIFEVQISDLFCPLSHFGVLKNEDHGHARLRKSFFTD